MRHSHRHPHDAGHAHEHGHSHGTVMPHPAQNVSWSLLRMTFAGRLAGAAAICVVLWAIVLTAMR